MGGRCDRCNKLVRFVHFTQPMALESLSVCMFRVCTCVCVGGNREFGLRGNNLTYKACGHLGIHHTYCAYMQLTGKLIYAGFKP